ncbi:hypothetical protein B0H11DRAFT_1915275 [Mycena galericulata]|nr:hypothetical protein B0H11DRAFT_1915275 [Mycena galericulata]
MKNNPLQTNVPDPQGSAPPNQPPTRYGPLLPNEVWTAILKLSRFHAILANVSVLWRHMVIDASSSASYISRYSANSRNQPLHLTILHTAFRPPTTNNTTCIPMYRNLSYIDKILDLCEAIRSSKCCNERWRSLEIFVDLPATARAIAHVLHKMQAPRLTHLAIICSPFKFHSPFCKDLNDLPAVFNGKLPALTHLEIFGVPPPWSPTAQIPLLTNLSIRCLPFDTWPTVTQLTDLLSHAVHLEKLELANFGVSDFHLRPVTITLPSITHLTITLHDASHYSLGQVMNSIRFPKLIHLHITILNDACVELILSSPHLLHCRRISIRGTVSYGTDTSDLFRFMTEVLVLDLRNSGSNLWEALATEHHITRLLSCPKLARLLVTGITWSQVRQVVEIRKKAGISLDAITWESTAFTDAYNVPEEHRADEDFLKVTLVPLSLETIHRQANGGTSIESLRC